MKKSFFLFFILTFSGLTFASTNNLQQNISELNKNAANFLHKDPNLSLTLSKSALSLANKYNNKEAQSESYFNIGMAFYVKGLYARALESHFEARRIAEKLENKKCLADANIGIGLVYHDEDKTNLSKQYFKESYVNYVQANSEKGIAHSLNMLGYAYARENNLDSAIYYYNKTLAVCEKINDPEVLASVYQDLATAFANIGNANDAIKYHNTSLKYSYLIGSAYNMMFSLNGLGEIYLTKNDFVESENNYKQALAIGIKNDLNPMLVKTYNGLMNLNFAKKNFEKAFDYQKMYSQLKDSLFTVETNNRIVDLEKRIQKEKEILRTQFLLKENLFQQSELRREKNLKYFYVGVAFLALLNFILLYNRFNVKKRSLELVRKKNRKIKLQKRKIESTNFDLYKKNKHIQDSISYALTIQNAMMLKQDDLKKIFPKHFLIHSTLETVSGDFFWAYQHNNLKFIVVADSTGHGVPGAFMSIIGLEALNTIVVENTTAKPNEILFKLDEKVRQALQQNGNNIELGNSIDLAFCVIDSDTNTILFSGAKRPLLFVSATETKLIKASHFSVGGNVGVNKKFEAYTLNYTNGDKFYLFSDGVTDQFGGPRGKKLTTKRLVAFIESIRSKEIEQQKFDANRFIQNWKINQEQIDDQLIVGIEL